jgi:homoaconitate hydratase
MTHDNTGPCISKFRSIGATKIRDPSQVVFALDHDVQNKSAKNLEKYSKIESFAREQGVDFYPAGRGIGHQVMVEEGYAFPQTLAVASDSHSNMYGGVGCVGTPIVRTDAAAIWATGQTWWQIPQVVKVELTGNLPVGVTGKDVIVALCGYFNEDQVLNAAIEFTGSGIAGLTVDERLAISNMTTEWGALAGVFPVDEVTLNWYEQLIRKMDKLNFQMGSSPSHSSIHPRLNMERLDDLSRNLIKPDSDAFYAKHLKLDLNTLTPHVSGPNSVKISTPLSVLGKQNIDIHKAYLVSCVNSRASDLKAAADVIRGKKVAKGVEFYVAAASSVVQRESEESGDWGALMAAGAKPLPAGCGPCIGLGVGLLEDGQVGISATNRNYKGRMGSPNAMAYLASPAVVAASAIEGKICSPRDLDPSLLTNESGLQFSMEIMQKQASPAKELSESSASSSQSAALLPGFPATFRGPVIFAPQDNLNTDGIYPGKYTYQDDITPDKQAQVVMENYDTSFAGTVASLQRASSGDDSSIKEGVILVSGYNFGTGSSREQAATALKYAGVPIVISATFGDIFKRNAINNGLVCLECEELVQDLTEEYARDGKRGNGGKTEGEVSVLLKGFELSIDSTNGQVILKGGDGKEKRYTTRPAGVGQAVQDIWTSGGLEAWVKARI